MVDCHVHITESGKWYNTSYDASVDTLLKQMDEAGIEKSVILPIYGSTSNKFVAETVKAHKDRLIGFGTTTIDSFVEDIEEIKSLGLQGIKFHPRIQNQTITQWDEAGVLAKLEQMQMPLLVCGWQQTASQVANMKNIQPNVIDVIAKKYKNLKIVIAHMGGHKFLDAFFCARGNANVYLDCSYFFSFFKGTSLEKDALVLFNKLDEKIIFGSDFPEINIAEYKIYITQKADEYRINLDKLMSGNIHKIINNG